MKYTFCNMGGINWNWLLCYEEVSEGVRMVFFQRWHRFDSDRLAPAWVAKCESLSFAEKLVGDDGFSRACEIVEGPGRVAIALRFAQYEEVAKGWNLKVGDRCYKHVGSRDVPVVNPQSVFGYNNQDEVREWVEKGGFDDGENI